VHRGFRYRLRPTAAQAQILREWIGTNRFVYNLALEQRRDFWRQYMRQTGKPLTWAQQSLELTELRAQVDWIAAVPRCALEQSLRDLDKAFANFFRGSGFPRPRRRGDDDTIRIPASEAALQALNEKWSAIRIPKLGLVKFRDTRPLAGRFLSATITHRDGVWYVALGQELPAGAVESRCGSVGIDRGVAQTLTLSTGEALQAPAMSALSVSTKVARRKLSRRLRGSGRYRSQRRKLSRLTAKAARVRSDWTHRVSRQIADRFGLVAIEALNVKAMTASAAGTLEAPGRNVRQKAGLNRSILEQCWGQFAQRLAYKIDERGGVLISVPAAYTSQTCAGCGVVDARSRKSQAVFACVHCDHTDNADVNAAKEILRRSTALMGVEGSHQRPAEALIMAAA
jgi:putative transposase